MRRTAWALVALPLLLVAPALAGDTLKEELQLQAGRVELAVHYPDGEELWAQSAATIAREALPALEKAAGFPWPHRAVEVTYAEDDGRTRGLDAVYAGNGEVLLQQTGRRQGYRGHALVTALAHGFSVRVALDPWLQEALAYLYTYHALGDNHQIYHARTFLLELIEDAEHAQGELRGWEPRRVHAITADPEVALAFGYLYATDRTLGEDALQRVGRELATSAPGTLDDLIAALDEATGEATRPYFVGWAIPDASDEPDPRWSRDDLRDPDDDLLLNFEEQQAGTDPENPDTSGDGRLDGEVVHDYGADPTQALPRGRVVIDGDPGEWLRLKKFRAQGVKGSASSDVEGADLWAYSIAADDDFLYVMVEASAFASTDVTYNLAFAGGESPPPWDYIVSFRSNGARWLVDTRGQNDLRKAEHRNDRRMHLAFSDQHAELRLPLAAMRLPPTFTVVAYTIVNEDGRVFQADTLPRARFDLERWRH